MSDALPPTPEFQFPNFRQAREQEITLGGVLFNLIEYEDDMRERTYAPRYKHTQLQLPIDMVTGLANASYGHPGEAQQILAALTPFQILSKLWAAQIVGKALTGEQVQIEEQFIFPGAWYGQQLAIMRRNSMVRMRKPLLIDMDPNAISVARNLLSWDAYARGQGLHAAQVIQADIFDQESPDSIEQHIEWSQRLPTAVYVWNGLEHFDQFKVMNFIAHEPKATFCLQSTNMDADDHHAKALVVTDLLNYVPRDRLKNIQYLGQLDSPFGSRFMVMFDAS